jgi:hypothetical protein
LIHRKAQAGRLDIVSWQNHQPTPEFSMRRLFAALSTPIDPVVAIHASSDEADATLQALGRAGYGPGMLAVVGQAVADRDGERFLQELAIAPRNWAASGLVWGALWAACTSLATLTIPPSAWGFAILASIGVAALALHVLVAWRVVASEPTTRAATAPKRPVVGPACSCRFQVLVRGSRSDIALARMVLSH